MPDVNAASAGQNFRNYRRGAVSTDPVDQYVIPTRDRVETYRGRAASFRIFGIAGTAGQRLMTIFNAVGSGIIVDVELVTIDVAQTAARVVEPPIIRGYRLTAAPTGGTAMSKAPVDSAQSSSASVTLLQAASNETGTATAITATHTTLVNQEVAPRALTLVGYEQFDRVEWFNGTPLVLRAGEGLSIFLDYSAATANPISDKWVGMVQWSEYTRP